MDDSETLIFFKIVDFIFKLRDDLEFVSILEVFDFCRSNDVVLSCFYKNYHSFSSLIEFLNFNYFSSFKH